MLEADKDIAVMCYLAISFKVNARKNRNRNNQKKITVRRKTREVVGKKTYFLCLSILSFNFQIPLF